MKKQFDFTPYAVEITSVPNDGAKAKVSDLDTESLKLVNPNATMEAKKLAAYLRNMIKEKQMLFGHQNSAHISVRKDGKCKSDVEDMTGYLPGIVGLDSLALSGCEMKAASSLEAVDKMIEVSIEAAKKGAILTLSTHIPNFTDDRFEPQDGVYDFSDADFMDCKNLTGDCVRKILTDSKIRARYNAYLDLVVKYGQGLKDANIPLLYRPFHENNGGWFWWGSDTTTIADFKEIFHYTVRYMLDRKMDNFLFVYSPNGPFPTKESYLDRYPGNDYLDVLAIDYYDDYHEKGEKYRDTFMVELNTSCQVINELAKENGKIPAISEVGSRVMRDDGILGGINIKNNPMLGHKWFHQVRDITINNEMPYYLVWGNHNYEGTWLPYKHTETTGHEMVDEFIDFFNEDDVIFAGGTNFY